MTSNVNTVCNDAGKGLVVNVFSLVSLQEVSLEVPGRLFDTLMWSPEEQAQVTDGGVNLGVWIFWHLCFKESLNSRQI